MAVDLTLAAALPVRAAEVDAILGFFPAAISLKLIRFPRRLIAFRLCGGVLLKNLEGKIRLVDGSGLRPKA